jgi:hypothetical protein
MSETRKLVAILATDIGPDSPANGVCRATHFKEVSCICAFSDCPLSP